LIIILFVVFFLLTQDSFTMLMFLNV